MVNVALVFPGQGAQYVGMGREFYRTSPLAKAIFDEADQILKKNLSEIIFKGPPEKLTSTAYCQPAMLTFSLAAFRAFEAHPKFQNISTQFAAGLSLGEYTALAVAGSLSLDAALTLVERRALYMEEAAKENAGKMAAVIGLEKDKISDICRNTGVEIANYNSPQQIVITGHAKMVEAASERIKKAGAKTVIPLEVSGAFHSSLMKSAADKFLEDLGDVTIEIPEFPVISNVDATPTTNPDHIRKNLADQITSPVQWTATVEAILQEGVEDFIEIGPGKVLSGLIRRISDKAKVHNIERPEDFEKLPF